MRAFVALLMSTGLWSQPVPGAKAMFYDPGDRGALPVTQPATGLRPIDSRGPFLHCGIHYWLETEAGARVTEATAKSRGGKFAVHIRNNVGGGFLTVWDVSGAGRELTPRSVAGPAGKWAGYLMYDQVYAVPGKFEFTSAETAPHLIIVWARSQTEVAHSAQDARARVKQMPAWMKIVSESDELTPGEIGTYVMNRQDAGVVAEITFRSR